MCLPPKSFCRRHCWEQQLLLAALSSNSASQACSESLVQAPPPADAAVRTRPTCQGPPALSCPRACVWSHARRGWRPGAAPPLAAGHAHAPSTAWDKKQKGNPKEQQQDNSNLFKSKTPRGHRRVGPPFPANPWYKVSNFHHKILTLGEKREEDEGQGGGDGKSSALLFLREGKEKNWERERRWLSTSPKYPTSSNTRRTKLPLDIKLN